METQSLQQEVESLRDEVQQLKNKNRLLNELALFYADQMNEFDGGLKARKLIKSLSKGYKPVDGLLAVMFKEKDVYPFVEFGCYIDDRLENEE